MIRQNFADGEGRFTTSSTIGEVKVDGGAALVCGAGLKVKAYVVSSNLARSQRPSSWLIGSLGAAVIVAAAYAYFGNDRVSRDEELRDCVASESEQSPALRMETCSCFTDEVTTALWMARMRLTTKDRQETLREVTLNVCRARAFQRMGGDRAPTRMSPMPRLTN